MIDKLTEEARRFKRNYRKGTLRYNIMAYYAGYPIELWNRWFKAAKVKNEPQLKFIIFTSGRSGSTLLVDLLNSNPNVQCDSEILKRRVAFPNALVRHFEQKSKKSIYGWKLLSYQLLNVQTGIKDKSAFIYQLVKEENYKILYLKRNDKVKQALSIIYAFYRGTWHSDESGHQNAVQPFALDPKVFYHFLKEVDILDKFEEELMATVPHLFISYEEDLSDPAFYGPTIKCISDFLGIDIPAKPPSTDLKKVTPTKLTSMITNKQQVIDYLAGTPYEDYMPVLEKM